MTEAIKIELKSLAPYDVPQFLADTPLIKTPYGYQRRTNYTGTSVDVTFKGFELVVELDWIGDVEGLMNATDGTDCLDVFKDWAIVEIRTLAHLAQVSQDDLSEPDGSGV